MPDPKQMIGQVNIADSLSDEELKKISTRVFEGYQTDMVSRKMWEIAVEEWLKMATLLKEPKTYPWPKASNVKYPIVATAAMQFSARAYPTLIPSDGQVVRCKVIGKDMDGQKAARADRLSKFMSWQLIHDMPCWEDDMDKLLITLPVIGCVFKKTFYDKSTDKNVSKLVMPQDLVINYWAKDLENAERKTERLEMSPRLVKERQLEGVFREVKLHSPQVTPPSGMQGTNVLTPPPKDDETTPYIILEQHTFLDLDDDGYEEPYIVTFEEKSKEVLRISARYDVEDVKVNDKGKVTSITPTEYYTKYGFIPNPDGGFYDVGFGLLLGPINDSVNSIINQLIDAGTLSNLQAGFIGKGLRIRMGESRFTPGEWKMVNASGDDIKKQVFPLPVREPSGTLLKLLELLIQSSKELASISEIFVGKMPGQNTPATTTMATIEQGMKVFTAIYKRVYRSLTEELYKLFMLNKRYLDPQTETAVLDESIGPDDFDKDNYDVCPTADPSATSKQEKLAKAQALMEVGGQLGTLDKIKVTERVLDALEESKELISQQGPPPDPKVEALKMKAQIDQAKAQQDMQKSQMDAALAQRESETKLKMEAAMNQQEMMHKAEMATMEMQASKMKMMMEGMKGASDMAHKDMDHKQKMVQSDEQHKQKMKQQPPVKTGK
jgi:chaperonin GroES